MSPMRAKRPSRRVRAFTFRRDKPMSPMRAKRPSRRVRAFTFRRDKRRGPAECRRWRSRRRHPPGPGASAEQEGRAARGRGHGDSVGLLRLRRLSLLLGLVLEGDFVLLGPHLLDELAVRGGLDDLVELGAVVRDEADALHSYFV